MSHKGGEEEKDKAEINKEINNSITILLATGKIPCNNLLDTNNHHCAPVAAWLGLQKELAEAKGLLRSQQEQLDAQLVTISALTEDIEKSSKRWWPRLRGFLRRR